MEALAACHAVRLCKELEISHLILEGDAKNVVTAVNDKEASSLKHGPPDRGNKVGASSSSFLWMGMSSC